MLDCKKTINLSGSSVIDSTVVANFHATVNADGTSNMSSAIVNNAMYRANRAEVRQDEESFKDVLYEIEDSLVSESADPESEEE